MPFCRREYGGDTAALALVGTTSLYIAFTHRSSTWRSRLYVGDPREAESRTERASDGIRGRRSAGLGRSSRTRRLHRADVGSFASSASMVVAGGVGSSHGRTRDLPATCPVVRGRNAGRPDFAYYGLVRESLARFTTPTFHRTAPVYYFISR
jgi:hypothetical protein